MRVKVKQLANNEFEISVAPAQIMEPKPERPLRDPIREGTQDHRGLYCGGGLWV
jgi:hypothetical protein